MPNKHSTNKLNGNNKTPYFHHTKTAIRSTTSINVTPETQTVLRDEEFAKTRTDIEFHRAIEDLATRVSVIEDNQSNEQTSEKLTNYESLYDQDSVITKIIGQIKKGTTYLNDALDSYEDEIQRVNSVDLFANVIDELGYILIKYPSYQLISEIVTMIRVSLYNSRLTPLDRNQIYALIKISKDMVSNIKLSDEKQNDIIDILEDADFDISTPLSDIEGLHQLE